MPPDSQFFFTFRNSRAFRVAVSMAGITHDDDSGVLMQNRGSLGNLSYRKKTLGCRFRQYRTRPGGTADEHAGSPRCPGVTPWITAARACIVKQPWVDSLVHRMSLQFPCREYEVRVELRQIVTQKMNVLVSWPRRHFTEERFSLSSMAQSPGLRFAVQI